jgi:hypothetical protein
MRAVLRITAEQVNSGILVSLRATGDYADEMIDRRFYSISDLPPAGLEPRLFWAPLLEQIGGVLGMEDEA